MAYTSAVLSVCGVETQHNTENPYVYADKLLLPTDVNVLLLLLLQGVILAVHLLQGFQEC